MLACLLCLGTLKGLSQEEFVPPPAKLLTQFSFKTFTGGVILVQARVSNYPDTLNFILDTGSGGISLDSVTANYLTLKLTKSDKTIRGIAGVKLVEFAIDHTLKLKGMQAADGSW